MFQEMTIHRKQIEEEEEEEEEDSRKQVTSL
jgi:hypothetical protein